MSGRCILVAIVNRHDHSEGSVGAGPEAKTLHVGEIPD